jgi:hypothetical protein
MQLFIGKATGLVDVTLKIRIYLIRKHALKIVFVFALKHTNALISRGPMGIIPMSHTDSIG